MASDTFDPILSEREYRAWLGISAPTAQRQRAEGSGPPFVQLSRRRIGYRKSNRALVGGAHHQPRWITSQTNTAAFCHASRRGHGVSEFDKDDKDRAATPTVPPLAGKADGVTATVTGPTAADTAMPTALNAGSVRLRRTTVALASEVGEEFVTDCARHLEGAVSDAEVKRKWELGDRVGQGLQPTPHYLWQSAPSKRRVVNGECARRPRNVISQKHQIS